MIKYLIMALALALSLSAAFGAYQYVRADKLKAERNEAREDASQAKAVAAAARFNHSIALEALREAERERDTMAQTLNDWRKAHAENLDNPADPALLDLIERLRRGTDSDEAPAD